METIPNTLAHRYASKSMRTLWSPKHRILEERLLWIAVLEAQKEAGIPISEEAIEAYKRVALNIDLQSIRERERSTHHDVKARIDEFCALAGHQEIHKGLTSRDLTESIEQQLCLKALALIQQKGTALLEVFAKQASKHKDAPLVARTHNVPAQLTTYGRRLAYHGEETLLGLQALEDFIDRYPTRGLQGAIGTCTDLFALSEESEKTVQAIQQSVLKKLGHTKTLSCPSQIYPRSLDFALLSTLMQVTAGAVNFSQTFRLMAGLGLVSEPFPEGQTGSSAMPHKQNPRLCERIHGLFVILRGFLVMLSELAGEQWNEGDVSCSVTRRVALPDAFFAADGLLDTALHVASRSSFHTERAQREVDTHLPFILSSQFLMASIQQGVGREKAHTHLKQHYKNAMESGNNPLAQITADPELKLSSETIAHLIDNAHRSLVPAKAQIDAFIKASAHKTSRFPENVDYLPETPL